MPYGAQGFGKKSGVTSLSSGAIGAMTASKFTFSKAAAPVQIQTIYVTTNVNVRSDDEIIVEKSILQIFNQIIKKKNVGLNRNRLEIIRTDLQKNFLNKSFYDPNSVSVFPNIELPDANYFT